MRSPKPGLNGGAAACAGAAVCALTQGPNMPAATKTRTRTSACLSIDYPHANGGARRPLGPYRARSSCRFFEAEQLKGLPHRRRRRNIASMHFARQVLFAAVMLASLVGAAHAGPAGCELNKVAPARVVTKEPRLQFVAGGGERTP